jgi:hypothetical protein
MLGRDLQTDDRCLAATHRSSINSTGFRISYPACRLNSDAEDQRDQRTHKGSVPMQQEAGHGSNLQALEYAVGADEKLVDIVQALRVIEGDSARLMRQGQTLKLITHYSELPRDVLPIVLNDASADLNRAYTHMEETYGIITKLASASKDYEALTIRKVGVPASRSVFKTKPKEYLLIPGS